MEHQINIERVLALTQLRLHQLTEEAIMLKALVDQQQEELVKLRTAIDEQGEELNRAQEGRQEDANPSR